MDISQKIKVNDGAPIVVMIKANEPKKFDIPITNLTGDKQRITAGHIGCSCTVLEKNEFFIEPYETVNVSATVTRQGGATFTPMINLSVDELNNWETLSYIIEIILEN